MKQEKIAYFQWLRILAAFAVVLMHTAAKDWTLIPIGSPQFRTLTMLDSLVRWPVPVFVMITGALFLPRKTELKRVLTRYIPRLLVAWLVWSWIHANYAGGTEQELLKKFLTGHYHLWYLPFLMGVYLVLPFLQKIAVDRQLTRQLLAVSMVVALGLPWLADLLALLYPESASHFRTVENHLNFSFFFDHLSLLLLGHVLHRTELRPGARWALYAAGILSIAVTGQATLWATNLAGKASSLFFDHAAPTTLCAAAALFVFAKYHLTKLPKIVDWVARHSFGVYLCHVYFLELLADNGFPALTWDPVWSVPVVAVTVFAISLAVTAVVAKIPVIGKFLT